MTVVKESVHLMVMKNVIHHLVENVLEDGFGFPSLYWVSVFCEFSSLLESQEQMLLIFIHIGVGMHASHLHFVLLTSVPVNGAFNLTFEMSWESSWVQGHLDVLMR